MEQELRRKVDKAFATRHCSGAPEHGKQLVEICGADADLQKTGRIAAGERRGHPKVLSKNPPLTPRMRQLH